MTSWVFSTVRLRNGAADRTHAMQARSTVGLRRFPRPVGVALFRAGRLVMSVMAAQMTVLRPTRPTSEQLTVINKHKPGSSSYRVPPASGKTTAVLYRPSSPSDTGGGAIGTTLSMTPTESWSSLTGR